MDKLFKIVIIIPTYNESDVIAETIHNLQNYILYIKNADIKILIYDSNSPDGTPAVVNQLQTQYSNLELVIETKKSGLGSAYIQAMKYAMNQMAADAVIEYDADGSHQPHFIPPMIAKLQQGYDVVVGSRYIPGGSIPNDWGLHRKILSVAGNWFARLFLTAKYKDFTSGLRITRSSFLKLVPLEQLLSKQYAYKIHLLWALHKAHAKITEYPIEFIDRKKGYSKFPRNNIIDSMRVVLTLRLKEISRYLKVCMVGLVGLILQLIVFNLMRQWLHPALANMFAVECAIISNFIFNNSFSFLDKKIQFKKTAQFFKAFIKFNTYSILSIVTQTSIVFFATKYIGTGAIIENGFVLLGIAGASIINYFIYSRLIWKTHQPLVLQ